MANPRNITWPDGKVRLPNPRISAFPQAPGRLMGPGPSVGKPGAPPPERGIFFSPINGLGYSGFAEVWRESVRGYSHGRIIVSADVVVSATTAGTFVAPFLWVDAQIVGYTNGMPEVLGYGAPGSTKTGNDAAYALPTETSLDAPPYQCEWDDSFGFDEVAVCLRTMGNGGQPFGPVSGWNPNPGDAINVSVLGKLWK